MIRFLIDTEMAFDKIQHTFMVKQQQQSNKQKNLDKLGMEGNFLNLIKVIYEKPTAYIILNDEILKAFPLSPGIRHEHSLFPFLLNIILEVLARAIIQEKEDWKGRSITTSISDDIILYIENPK